VMGVCNTAPTQYIVFNDADITIVTPKLIIMGDIETTGTIKNNTKTVGSIHTHGGVQTGGGTTGQVS
jgi:hypothetical protein